MNINGMTRVTRQKAIGKYWFLFKHVLFGNNQGATQKRFALFPIKLSNGNKVWLTWCYAIGTAKYDYLTDEINFYIKWISKNEFLMLTLKHGSFTGE